MRLFDDEMEDTDDDGPEGPGEAVTTAPFIRRRLVFSPLSLRHSSD
jgi:hypothetical protein